MHRYDFSPLFRYSVGFDRLERLLDAASSRVEQSPSYPPYNIESVTDNAYRITVAVAGFSEGDLDITQRENALVISGKSGTAGENAEYLHRGIANRAFERRFDLADHVKVVAANLENGMLTVDLEREIPEALKPRQIDIKKGPAQSLAAKAKKLLGAEDNPGEKRAA